MEILFTFKIKAEQEADLLRKFPTYTFHFPGTSNCEEVETADVIVTYGGNIDVPLLNRAQSLKWIMVASAGVDKMPLAEIAKRDVIVTNVRGIHKTPMAESVIAHILAIKRSIPEIYALQETKEWGSKFSSTELRGSSALILGTGAIGSEIGRLLQAFGVRTIGCNTSGRVSAFMDEGVVYDQLMDKLPEADFVISILPSTPETRGLLTAAHFNVMKKTAVFMNFGRGDLFDEEILIDVLKNEVISHAVLDVFKTEPLPEDSLLWTLSNCTVSPHISSKSGMYIQRSLEIFEENLVKWSKGDTNLINTINPIQGY